MYNYSLVKYSAFSFTFIIYISILCHTVVSPAGIVPSHQNDSTSKTTSEQVKRDGKKQEKLENSNQSKTVSTFDEMHISSESINVTDHKKPPFVEDQFNSTAGLPSWMLNIKEGALQRTGYVALGFMSIVMIFFVIRAVRLRQKRSKSRKYGIITSNVSDMEMEPLDRDDDEEEDATLFDAQHKYSLQ